MRVENNLSLKPSASEQIIFLIVGFVAEYSKLAFPAAPINFWSPSSSMTSKKSSFSFPSPGKSTPYKPTLPVQLSSQRSPLPLRREGQQGANSRLTSPP